jgi:DNA-binding MarR family transcriptional regulator
MSNRKITLAIASKKELGKISMAQYILCYIIANQDELLPQCQELKVRERERPQMEMYGFVYKDVKPHYLDYIEAYSDFLLYKKSTIKSHLRSLIMRGIIEQKQKGYYLDERYNSFFKILNLPEEYTVTYDFGLMAELGVTVEGYSILYYLVDTVHRKQEKVEIKKLVSALGIDKKTYHNFKDKHKEVFDGSNITSAFIKQEFNFLLM